MFLLGHYISVIARIAAVLGFGGLAGTAASMPGENRVFYRRSCFPRSVSFMGRKRPCSGICKDSQLSLQSSGLVTVLAVNVLRYLSARKNENSEGRGNECTVTPGNGCRRH
ncbi:DUF1328 domain-containing protein [Salmonella enterica subsp. enterica]|nr:DUF1328 domain-containing protein [Salmonella enterica subsp. enterica]